MSETPTTPRGSAPPGAKAPPGFKAASGATSAPKPAEQAPAAPESATQTPKVAATPPGSKPPPGAKAPPGAAAPRPVAPAPAPVAVAAVAKPAAPKLVPTKIEPAPAAVASSAPKSVTRREFLNYVWGASMALFLAQFGGISFLFAYPRFREGEVGGRFSQSVTDFGYDANGLPNANNVGKFWMVKIDDTINAIYKVCTHLGCLYGWNGTGKIFACPCHGSQFQVNGTWIAGPAPRNLDRFKMQVLDANGNVLATSDDAGNMIKLPAGADRVVVDTGSKISGKNHF